MDTHGAGGGRNRKDMTRGQFLAAGAVAAAGAARGSPISLEDVAIGGVEPKQLAPTWETNGRMLTILWSHVFPRVVARAWELQTGVAIPTQKEINWTRAELLAAIDESRNWGTKLYQDRAGELHTHLNTGKGKDLPIVVFGMGGYDYAIGSNGLYLSYPARPDNVLELVRFYSFRESARKAVGVPGLLPPALLPIDASVSARTSGNSSAPGLMTFNKDRLKTITDVNQNNCIDFMPDPKNPNNNVLMSFDAYQDLLRSKKARSWHVPGVELGRVLAELPRVAAQIWIERYQNTSLIAGSVHRRYKDEESSCRALFEERLELTLPSGMTFKSDASEPQPGVPRERDALINQSGILLPAVDDLSVVAGGSDVLLSRLFGLIRDGKAGNPVFTDSQRSE